VQAGHEVGRQVGVDAGVWVGWSREALDAAGAIKRGGQLGLRTGEADIGVGSRVVDDRVGALPSTGEPHQLNIGSQTRSLRARIHRAFQGGENVDGHG
jgi:hypothetical protein